MQRKKLLMPSKSSKSIPKLALEEIMQMLRDRLPQPREEYSISDIWLFVSCVRGEQLRRSDLDILVEFEEVPTLPRFISLERKLHDITGIKSILYLLAL